MTVSGLDVLVNAAGILTQNLPVDELPAAIVFLASPLASAITGVVLPVDEGWTAGEPVLPW